MCTKLNYFSAKHWENIKNFIASVIRVLTVPGVTRVMGVIDESVTGVTGVIDEVLQCL